MLSRAQEARVRAVLWSSPAGIAQTYCLEHLASAAKIPPGHISDLAVFVRTFRRLRQIAPKIARVGILWNPDHTDPDFRETRTAAPKLGVAIVSLEVRRPDDFEAAFKTALQDRIDALIVVSSRLMTRERQRILEFAATHRLPVMTGWGACAAGGALLTYGPNVDDIIRRSAVHVDKILRGARPRDLPVEQPTRFELVINLKTSKALGLTIPPALLLQADQVNRVTARQWLVICSCAREREPVDVLRRATARSVSARLTGGS